MMRSQSNFSIGEQETPTEGIGKVALAPHQPWYREPWPWILMAGPALTVVAGFVTLWLALASDDGPAAGDDYQRGPAAGRALSRDRAAAALAYRAHLRFDPGAGRVRVVLSGGLAAPRLLLLRMTHPTRAGLDRLLTLEPRAPGSYEAGFALPASARWRVTLEDPGRVWRLIGEWPLPGTPAVTLEPAGP